MEFALKIALRASLILGLSALFLNACGGGHRADPFGPNTSGSGSGSGSGATPTPTPVGGSGSWPTVWPTYILWKNGGMPPAPNSFFQFVGITYQNDVMVGAAGGLNMRWRGTLGAGPPDNVTGDASTLMISDNGVLVPPAMPGGSPTCFRNVGGAVGIGTASLAFVTCPHLTYCYDGVTNTTAYLNTGGAIEFNLKMEMPTSQIGSVRIEYGKDADCMFYKVLYPNDLSSTSFIHYSISINDSVWACPVNDNQPAQMAFVITAFPMTLACGAPIYSINDIRWVNY